MEFTFVETFGKIGENCGPWRLLVAGEGRLGRRSQRGRAVAGHEDCEAVLELVVREETVVVRLKPAHRPVGHIGLRARHGDSIGRDDNQVEFRVDALLVLLR